MTIHIKIFLLTFCLSFIYLINRNISVTRNAKVSLVDTIPKDIPTYKDGSPSLSYLYSKKYQEILHLQNIDEGVDSIEIRIWYTFSFVDTGQLIVLKYDKREWEAKFYTFNYKHEYNLPSIKLIQKSVEEKKPKSGWNQFVEQLFNYNIKTLPDDSKLPGFSLHTDGDGISIEVATSCKYRVYGYQMNGLENQKFKEFVNMELIVELIADEFDFSPLRPLTDKQANFKDR